MNYLSNYFSNGVCTDRLTPEGTDEIEDEPTETLLPRIDWDTLATSLGQRYGINSTDMGMRSVKACHLGCFHVKMANFQTTADRELKDTSK